MTTARRAVKSIDEWFDEYSDSHQNQTNKKIHWVCVPAILFSIIGILAHFSTLLTALLLVLTLVLCTPRHRACSSDGSVISGDGMADFDPACRRWILYRDFCDCMDWAILWA